MAAKGMENPHEEEEEGWLLTYADMITLLMAFFVMLINFTKYDMPAMEEAASAIKNEVKGGEPEKSPTANLKNNIQDIVYEMQADQVVNVSTDDKGVVIELASSAFYRPGSAEFRDEAIPVLTKITQSIMDVKYKGYNMEVEGHTDDDPISTAQFPSNWELSTGRATRVVRFFVTQGMEAKRLKAIGFADTIPKVPNRNAEGAPIRENQAQNRRVNIRMSPSLDMQKSSQTRRRTITDLIETTPAVPAPGQPGAAGGGSGSGGMTGNRNVITDVLHGMGVR
jgi:chemotaxis protein MotB